MKLLTIAIPTYNRSKCLDLCLSGISSQIGEFESDVEVVIYDNCSPDDTALIVNKYTNKHKNIRYYRNNTNVGSEKNFILCYEACNSQYCWLFGDDDLLLEDALKYLIPLLKNGTYGSIFLSAHAFIDDYYKELPQTVSDKAHLVYNNRFDYFKRVNIDATFITSNIVNKAMIPNYVKTGLFCGTSLVHLGWILPAIFYGEKHLYIERQLIAGKAFNSGGFRFFNVFADNLNMILMHFRDNGMSTGFHKEILNKLMIDFYPHRIMTIRSKKELYDDSNDNIFVAMYKNYKTYLFFWIFVIPPIFLPVVIAKPFCRIQRSIYKRIVKIKALVCS